MGIRQPKRRNGTKEKLQKNQQEHDERMQLQQSGQRMQEEELRDLLHNPQVMEMLLEPDTSSWPSWLEVVAGEHLHMDQVLAIFDEDDLWRKAWGNKITATKITMHYPPQESRSSSDLVNETQKRIHGHDKQPLLPDQRRRIEAAMEQKTDREKRAKGGEYGDLLLSQVVRSEERSSDSGDSSSSLLGLGGD